MTRPPSFPMTRVAIIGVTYESDDAVQVFMKSLREASVKGHDRSWRVDWTTLVVDNTEREDSSFLAEVLHNHDPGAILVKAPTNLGYFGGARLGLRRYLESAGIPDWLVISNVDVEIDLHTFLEVLPKLTRSGDIGVIAPSVWSNTHNRDWNPKMVRRPSRRRMHLYKTLFASRVGLSLFEFGSRIKSLILPWRSKVLLASSHEHLLGHLSSGVEWQKIYAPHGACLAFSSSYFEAGGDLEYPGFLFGEEVFVAETARALGLQVAYVPTLRVSSRDHVSTGVIRSREMARHIRESASLIFELYFG